MDIDHIDGEGCLVFRPGDPMLALLRETRNREVFNKLLTDRSGVGLRREDVFRQFAAPNPRIIEQLEAFDLIAVSFAFGMTITYVVTDRVTELLELEDGCNRTDEIIVFKDRIDVLSD